MEKVNVRTNFLLENPKQKGSLEEVDKNRAKEMRF
jgi:hypothetical protein